ncbi:MAG: hypothetical protein ACOCUI_05880 [bacterium]
MKNKKQFKGNARLVMGALLLAAAGTLFTDGIATLKGMSDNEE